MDNGKDIRQRLRATENKYLKLKLKREEGRKKKRKI